MSTETVRRTGRCAASRCRSSSSGNLREYGLLLALIAIMVFFQFTTNGTLFKPVNLTNLVLQNSYIIIMALGMLLVIVAGHIDLSVGSVCRLHRRAGRRDDGRSSRSTASRRPIICLAVGGVIGAAQGYWIAYLQDPELHRDAGRHAGVQGPVVWRCWAASRSGRSRRVPDAELRLHPRRHRPHDAGRLDASHVTVASCSASPSPLIADLA